MMDREKMMRFLFEIERKRREFLIEEDKRDKEFSSEDAKEKEQYKAEKSERFKKLEDEIRKQKLRFLLENEPEEIEPEEIEEIEPEEIEKEKKEPPPSERTDTPKPVKKQTESVEPYKTIDAGQRPIEKPANTLDAAISKADKAFDLVVEKITEAVDQKKTPRIIDSRSRNTALERLEKIEAKLDQLDKKLDSSINDRLTALREKICAKLGDRPISGQAAQKLEQLLSSAYPELQESVNSRKQKISELKQTIATQREIINGTYLARLRAEARETMGKPGAAGRAGAAGQRGQDYASTAKKKCFCC